MYVSACHGVIWRTEGNLWESIFSNFNQVDPRVGTEVVSLGARDFTCVTILLVPNEVFSILCSQYPIKESWMNRELVFVGWGFDDKPPSLSLGPSFLICNLRALTQYLWCFIFSYFLMQGRPRLLGSEGEGAHSRLNNSKLSLSCRDPCLRILYGGLWKAPE